MQGTPTNSGRASERIARISLVMTILIVVAKLITARLSGSISVQGEALQSLVDILVSFGVLMAIRIAQRPPDDTHPYGHGRAEILISGFQLMLISATAVWVVMQAIQRLQSPAAIETGVGLIGMIAAGLASLGMSAWVGAAGKKLASPALKSESLHLRGDSVASLGIVVGLALVSLTGAKWIDATVAIVLMGWIVVSSIRQLGHVVHELMDGAAPVETQRQIESVLNSHPEVRGFHKVRTRTIGSFVHVDLHVLLDDHLSFVQAHDLAEEIEDEISAGLGGAHVSVHYEPHEHELRHQEEFH